MRYKFMPTLHVYSNVHIKNQVKNINKGDWIFLENKMSRNRWSLYFRINNINENALGITYIDSEEYFNLTDKRFDEIVGNPPYTKGNKKLYTRFTEKALELSDSVTFIMPVDLDSNHVTLKAHNKRVKTHLKELGENISHEFDVNLNNIHTVMLDANITNEVDDYKNPLDNYELILKDRARLKVFKGSNLVETAEEVHDGKQVIFRILKGNQIVTKNVSEDIIQKVNKNRKVSAPWIVFVNHTPSQGLFNCNYIKNENQPWSMNVIAIEANSEEEAKNLQKWLTSKTIQTEINKMFKLKNVYTVSKEILENLPNYE